MFRCINAKFYLCNIFRIFLLENTLISKLKKLLKDPKDVVIITHTHPDGDAMGSSLAFYHFLKFMGHRVQLVVPTEYPDFLSWMPGIKDVVLFEDNKEEVFSSLRSAALIFCLDFNSSDRMEGIRDGFHRSAATKILIDHHIERESFCDLAYTKTQTSSTSEMVYDLIEHLNETHLLNSEIAECLYVGIMTDTGSFSYACEYERTFLVTAALVKIGIDTERLHRLVYDTYSENRLRLLGYCLSERLIVLPELSTAYIALSMKDLERFDYKIGDTEGIVNYTLGIKGIVFGALITERKDKVKISLRSKGNFDVNRIARLHFNGGGHKNASGGDLYCTFYEAVKLFTNTIPIYSEELCKYTV
jgi:bifunctional oligoribonuclease and PAP phosphatase NrnA